MLIARLHDDRIRSIPGYRGWELIKARLAYLVDEYLDEIPQEWVEDPQWVIDTAMSLTMESWREEDAEKEAAEKKKKRVVRKKKVLTK